MKRCLLGLVICFAPLAVGRVARAQEARAPVSPARFAPADAGLYIEFERLADVDRRLSAIPARAVQSFLAGSASRAAASANCPAALAAHLGLALDARAYEVFAGHVALVAEDWDHFDDAVVLLKVADAARFDRFFGVDRSAPVPVNNAPHAVRSKNGVWVALGAGWAALSRRGVEESRLYTEIVRRLVASGLPSLDGAPQFRNLVGAQHGRGLARAYVEFRRDRRGSAAPFISNMRRCAATLNPRGEALEIELRADLASASGFQPADKPTLRRALALPQTTLLAWATAVDVPNLMTQFRQMPSTGLASTVAGLLAAAAAGDDAASLLAKVGPGAILVWGQRSGDAPAVPQLGLLLECTSAREVATALSGLAQGWVTTLRGVEGAGDAALELRHEEYLGTDIWTVPLGALVQTPTSRPGPLSWLGSLAPSFAAVDDWLVLTLSPVHLRQIVDATNGLIPTMRLTPGLANIDPAGEASVTYAVAQPGMIAQVLRAWLADVAEGRPSILDRQWWSAGESSPGPLQLGLGMDRQSEPGRVVVARIHPGRPADGSLKVGDRIVGVDGRLLSLFTPNDDLRRHIQSLTEAPASDPGRALGEGGNNVTFRVLRGDEMLDVTIALPPPPGTVDPVVAMRNIESLIRDVRCATYSATATGDQQMSARLTLMFSK